MGTRACCMSGEGDGGATAAQVDELMGAIGRMLGR
jgi:hypothetical protein